MIDSGSEFGRIRSVFWPIHGFELKKFIPMSFLLFANLFVYTIASNLKDIFVLSYATLGGTELIAPLKGVLVLPSAIFIAMIFSAIVNKFGMYKTFYICISFFSLFFLLFAFVLFPNASKIHLSAETMISMQNTLPKFLHYLIPCIGNWSFSLFFILAESWGVISIHSLFWHFSNRVTKKTEMNRFYALYHLIGCIGRLIAGKFIVFMSNVGNYDFNRSVQILISSAIAFCMISMLLYYYINKNILTDPLLCDQSKIDIKPKKKKKVGFFTGIKILFSSKYLFLILLLPISYGIGIHLFEVVLKGHIKSVSSNPSDTGRILGQLSQLTAALTWVSTFIGTYILRNFKWKYAAMFTPIVLLLTGGLFFLLMFYKKSITSDLFGLSVPLAILWIGMIADSIAKAMKYCLFDPTKSIAYRVLDSETQAQGQGAVEIVGGRGGKGLAAIVTMMFTSVFYPGSKVLDHMCGLFFVFLFTVIAWTFSCNKLGNLYEEKSKE